MPLKLGRPLKREVEIHGAPYTVTVSPLGIRLVRKGFRKGVAVSWRRLLQMAVGETGAAEPEGSGPAGGVTRGTRHATDSGPGDAGGTGLPVPDA
jgi:hypothetical protein